MNRRPEGMRGYRRPGVVIETFRDADGEVIPYGHRWAGPADEDAYSVTTHPERFAPVAQVGRALAAALAEEERGEGAPIELEITDFPGVIARIGHGVVVGFPQCGCDACDDDVMDLIERLEDLVGTVVEGRFAEGEDGAFGPADQPTRRVSDGEPRPPLAPWPAWRDHASGS